MNVLVGPAHTALPWVKVGVTTIEATKGEVPLLVAVKDAISPDPLEANPILEWLFVQV